MYAFIFFLETIATPYVKSCQVHETAFSFIKNFSTIMKSKVPVKILKRQKFTGGVEPIRFFLTDCEHYMVLTCSFALRSASRCSILARYSSSFPSVSSSRLCSFSCSDLAAAFCFDCSTSSACMKKGRVIFSNRILFNN